MIKQIGRKIGSALILYAGIPICFFVLLEIVLRLTGYGYNPNFFVENEINGNKVFVNSYKFSWRFFPKPMARLSASVVVPAVKDKNAIRIFVFGESAAMGDPEPAFSFSRMMQAMAEKKYPDKKIEIYNTAITAINSHVILPIVDDCLKLEPDMFVFYMGNNEVIGPYGLSTALTPFFSNHSVIKLQIWLSSIRLGQLVKNITSNDEFKNQEWRGMEMFAKNNIRYDSPELQKIYNHFQDNLASICKKANSAGVKIVFSTVPTNVVDCAPFYSLHNQRLTKDELSQWKSLYEKGILLANHHKYEDAITQFQQAARLDSNYAELNFRIGKCFQYLNRPSEAKSAFIKARDYDALRFRADSRINSIIRTVASENNALLADIESNFQKKDTIGGGNDLFYEHVHLNPKGNYFVAESVMNEVEKSLKLTSDGTVSFDDCLERLTYTAFDEKRIDEINLGRISEPPFTNQYLNKGDISFLAKKVDSLKAGFDSVFIDRTNRRYSAAIQRYHSDFYLHLNYLRFLYNYKFDNEASQQADALVKLIPYEYISYVNLGITRQSLKKYDDAISFFQKAIEINPYFSEAYRDVAAMYEERNMYSQAGRYLRKARASDASLAALYNRAGVNFGKLEYSDSAVFYFNKAIAQQPDFAEARSNLVHARKLKGKKTSAPLTPQYSDLYNKANELFRTGKFKEATEYYTKVLVINPTFPNAHNNLGVCLIYQNLTDEARIQFAEAIKYDPSFFEAYPNLGLALNQQGKFRETIDVLSKGLALKNDPELYPIIAEAYSSLGDHATAEAFMAKSKVTR